MMHSFAESDFGHRPWHGRGLRIVGAVIGGLVVATLLGLGLGLLVQYLWNALLVKLFSLPAITYWQAVGLFILAKLFFGGFSGHGRHAHGPGRGPAAYGKFRGGCHGRPEEAEAFSRFWDEEGQKAFDAYLERLKSSDQPGDKSGERKTEK